MGTPPSYRQLSLAVKYNTVLFPFDTVQFIQALESNAFLLTEQLAEVPFGARLQVSGIIARKGQLSVAIDTDKQLLSILSPNTTEVVEQMELLEGLLFKEFGLVSAQTAMFYEFQVTANVKSTNDPLTLLGRHFENVRLLQKLGDLLGQEVGPLGFRLSPKNSIPNQTDWFDIRFESPVIEPRKHFLIGVVYRNAKRENVLKFVRQFDSLVNELMKAIEQ